MAGTREGALKTRERILAKDPEYYKKLAKAGGAASTSRPFRDIPKLAGLAGAKGVAVREANRHRENKYREQKKLDSFNHDRYNRGIKEGII